MRNPGEASRALFALLSRSIGAVPRDLLVRHVLEVTARADWPVQQAALEALKRRWESARRDELKVARRPRALKAALAPAAGPPPDPRPRPRLSWDPITPLAGEGDWLGRLRLKPGAGAPARFAAARRWFKDDGSGTLVPRDLCREAPRRRLYPYQRQGVERMLSSGRLVLADDMGLGKTIQATAVCHALWKTQAARRLKNWSTKAAAGVRALFFTGREGQRRRGQNLVEFHDDPAARVLFATDAYGVGLNLQRAASCCINVDLPWNPAVLEQRIARIHRPGQTRPIDVYNLIGQNCIEQRIAAIVGDKKALFRGLFEGTSDEVRFDRSGSFMASVARIVEPALRAGGATADEPAAVEADEAAERELAAILDAGDEGRDEAPAPGASLVEAKPAPAGAEHRAAGEVAALFSRLTVRPTGEGGLRIDAPPETAAALFAGLSRALEPAPDRAAAGDS